MNSSGLACTIPRGLKAAAASIVGQEDSACACNVVHTTEGTAAVDSSSVVMWRSPAVSQVSAVRSHEGYGKCSATKADLRYTHFCAFLFTPLTPISVLAASAVPPFREVGNRPGMGFGSDYDPLDDGSDLSELDNPPTPGPALTPQTSPVHHASTRQESPPEPAQGVGNVSGLNRRGRKSSGRGAKGNVASSTSSSHVQATPAKKPAAPKVAKGWAYEPYNEASKAKTEDAEGDAELADGKRPRRRSAIGVQYAGSSARKSAQSQRASDGASTNAEKDGQRLPTVRVKLKRKAQPQQDADPQKEVNEKNGDDSDSASEDDSVVKPSSRKARHLLDDDEGDNGQPQTSTGRKRSKMAGQKPMRGGKSGKATAREQDDSDVDQKDAIITSEEESFSGDTSDSEEKKPKKKARKADGAKPNSSSKFPPQGKIQHPKPSVSSTVQRSPLPASASGPHGLPRPSHISQAPGSASAAPAPQGRPPAKNVVRKVSSMTLLNNLLRPSSGPSGGSGARGSPSRNVTPRPRPPGTASADSPGSAKRIPGSDRDVEGVASSASGRTDRATNAAGHKPGLNGNHVTANEMHVLRERERYDHAHPHGLIDLLEGAEIMMEFEEETRQELRYDAFLHKHKLYKPSRTEGVWKLVEHIKQRKAAVAERSSSASEAQAVVNGTH